ncbi:MAG: AbrB/MazE/SpoVT family DNA-binding domain-containing protein [Deltaproteobacteria bacterium]|nr:AbrB/MazE/SpoVT family DNA-binding domain-containing protein [Deltaproteobacteria bacterium]
MLTKKTSKNQLTLRNEIVKQFPDIDYFEAEVADRKIILTPVKMKPLAADLVAIRAKMKALGITPADVAEAVKWARKRD